MLINPQCAAKKYQNMTAIFLSVCHFIFLISNCWWSNYNDAFSLMFSRFPLRIVDMEMLHCINLKLGNGNREKRMKSNMNDNTKCLKYRKSTLFSSFQHLVTSQKISHQPFAYASWLWRQSNFILSKLNCSFSLLPVWTKPAKEFSLLFAILARLQF